MYCAYCGEVTLLQFTLSLYTVFMYTVLPLLHSRAAALSHARVPGFVLIPVALCYTMTYSYACTRNYQVHNISEKLLRILLLHNCLIDLNALSTENCTLFLMSVLQCTV